MKRFLLAMVLAFPLMVSAQTIQRNSITTNVLGTNLVWIPSAGAGALQIEQNAGAFQILSNGIAEVEISPSTGGNVLPALNLKQYLQFGSSSNRLTRSGANLLWDGLQLNGGSEAAPVNNFYATNIYSQNGAHNTMNISNYLTVSGQYVYPLVAGTGITFATNTISAGKTNLTISSAGGSTAVTTLTYSGTNIVGADMSTNGMSFYLLVTNHCLLGTATFSNLPAKTAYQTYTFCFQQDSAGGYVPKLTNSIWVWADGNQPVIKTNANAVSYIYAHTGLATNSTLVGTPNINIQ